VLSRLAALPRTFDLELALAVTWSGADRLVLRLLDRSLISPAAKLSNPRRFRLLEPLRAYIIGKTKPDTVRQVRSAHAAHHGGLAIKLMQRARTDDSREAAELASSLRPELNAAIRWAVDTGNGIALPMTRALAIGIEQYGAEIESLQTLTQAARDTTVREAATADDLFTFGEALCFSDLDLVADLTALALSRATDDASKLAAHHLAGLANAFADRRDSALAHLDVAEPLAVSLGDTWALASIRQARGIALRRGSELGRPVVCSTPGAPTTNTNWVTPCSRAPPSPPGWRPRQTSTKPCGHSAQLATCAASRVATCDWPNFARLGNGLRCWSRHSG
jgi:hypothetical protein